MDSEEKQEHSLVEKQAQQPELRSEEDRAWWSRGKRGKKGFSKSNESFRKCGFRTKPTRKGFEQWLQPTHRKKQGSKRKSARKAPIYNQGFQPLKTPLKRDKAFPWNQTIGIPTLPTIPQLQQLRGTIQNTLNGWHQDRWILPTIRRTCFWILAEHDRFDQELQSEGARNMHCIFGITAEFSPCNKSFRVPTLRQKFDRGSCFIHFPTTPPFSAITDVLETGDVPILFSLGYDYWTGSKKRQNYKSRFCLVLFSNRILHNETYCVGLDEACASTKIAWPFCSPDETCNFCSIATKSQHMQIVPKNWMTTKMTSLLFAQITPLFLKTKMKIINLCCILHPRKNSWSANLPQSVRNTYRVLHRIGSFLKKKIRYFWCKPARVRVKRFSLKEFYKKCHDVVAFFLLSSWNWSKFLTAQK